MKCVCGGGAYEKQNKIKQPVFLVVDNQNTCVFGCCQPKYYMFILKCFKLLTNIIVYDRIYGNIGEEGFKFLTLFFSLRNDYSDYIRKEVHHG